MFVLNIVNALEKAGIRYALIGGYAVAMHGAVRGTVDIDLVIALDKAQYIALEQAMNQLGLISRLPVSAHEVFQFREDISVIAISKPGIF